ncbi:hypothetical protein GmHk_18G052884 [Glycine max]|nr:hypothetical protein GmHk_18G052884 [Glycine max]
MYDELQELSMQKEFIPALDEHWGSTYFQNRSSTAKANQSVNRGASAYCGGSISTATHFEKLSKEFQRPPTAWEVMEKTKKLKLGEWVNDKSREFVEKYQHRRDEILQHSTKEDRSTQDSLNIATSINDNEIYLNVVGGPNYKGNMYGLGTLSKRFSCSKSAPSTSITLVKDQIEEMREIINKLNVELLAKANKEKTLEEKMLQLRRIMTTKVRRCDNRCKNKISKFVNKISKCSIYLQHLHIHSIMPARSLSPTITNGTEHHVNDA